MNDAPINFAEEAFFDEADAPNLYHEAAAKLMDFSDRRDMFILGKDGDTWRDRCFRHDCTLLAMGKAHILGADSAVKLAARWSCTKANVVKTVKKFQAVMGLPPTLGQRSLQACQKFAEVRKSQLA